MTKDEMVGWNHQLSGHEFEQTPGENERQGSLTYCSPWGRREADTTWRLNNNNNDFCSTDRNRTESGGESSMRNLSQLSK